MEHYLASKKNKSYFHRKVCRTGISTVKCNIETQKDKCCIFSVVHLDSERKWGLRRDGLRAAGSLENKKVMG